MDRRTFLASCGVTASITLAGCGDSGGATTTTTTAAVPTITDQAIETTSTECGTPDGSASVAFGETTVTIEGVLQAATPCHDATLVGVVYDADDDTLRVTVGASERDGMCVECVGRLDYEATVEFARSLPDRVVVEHGDGEPRTVADVSRS